jgi:hypothetical protein
MAIFTQGARGVSNYEGILTRASIISTTWMPKVTVSPLTVNDGQVFPELRKASDASEHQACFIATP